MSDLREYFRDRAAAAEKERDTLRAELASERERAYEITKKWRNVIDAAEKIVEQRAKLRDALVKARRGVSWSLTQDEKNDIIEAIDAVLRETGDE